MKTQLTNIKQSLSYAIAALLTVAAGSLAVSALKADSPKPRLPFGAACKNWPAKADQPKVEQAFDAVLKKSATDQSFRDRLLNKKDPLNKQSCYSESKQAVQDQLDSMPGSKVTIPDEAVIIFYEDDTPTANGHTHMRKTSVQSPSDHCLHIFYLPDFNKPAVARTSFRENLMCCYKPW